MPRPFIDLCVLDTLAADQEAFRDVVRLLNHDHVGWRDYRGGEAYESAEVAAALVRCIGDGLVEACAFSAETGAVEPFGEGALPTVELTTCRFQLTAHGRAMHAEWAPEPPRR